MNHIRRQIYHSVIAIVLAGLSASLNAATIDCPTRTLEMPSNWLVRSNEGITGYQNREGTQKLTAATYVIQEAFRSERGRELLMQKSADLSRDAELIVNSKHLQLTALTGSTAGAYRQQLFAGFDPASGRRFARFSVASVNCLQNFYYEATGLKASEFDRSAARLFNSLVTLDAKRALSIATKQLRVPSTYPPLVSTKPTIVGKALPTASLLAGP